MLESSTNSSDRDNRDVAASEVYPVKSASELPYPVIPGIYAESQTFATRHKAAHGKARGKVNIMPVGDSITYGVIDSNRNTQMGGYRTYLWQALTTSGYNVNFVGSQASGPKSIDRDHEGYRGETIAEISDLVSDQIAKEKPDIVLLLAGTNDILHDKDLDEALKRLSVFIDQVLKISPKTTVLVGTLPPNTKSGNSPEQIRDFNASLTDIVNQKIDQNKNVALVDLYNRLTNHDLQDQTHPTAAGYKQIAESWYEAIADVLDDDQPASESDDLIGNIFIFTGATKNQALRSSTLAGNHYDRLIHFDPGAGDRIQLNFDNNLDTTGRQERPQKLFNTGIQIEKSLEQAIAAAYADVSLHQQGDQKLKPNQAVIFQYRKNFYLAVNNHKSGFQPKSDLFVDLGKIATGFAPDDLHTGPLTVTNYFV